MKFVIRVRFYEPKKNRLSASTYRYMVDNTITEYAGCKYNDSKTLLIALERGANFFWLHKIKNTKDYDYRGSDIVIEGIEAYSSSDENLIELKEIVPHGEPLPRDLWSEIDTTPVNIDMIFNASEFNTQNLPSGTLYYCNGNEWVEMGNVSEGEVHVHHEAGEIPTYEFSCTGHSMRTLDSYPSNLQLGIGKIEANEIFPTLTSLINSQPTTACTIPNKNNTVKEENTMFENIFKNLKFGKATNVRMSIYGPAFYSKTNKEWIAFNNGDLTNVDGMTLEGESFCYMMPVAHDKVMIGDFILHNDTWGRVNYIDEATLSVEMPETHELVNVLPMKNIFGFNFYTKLVSLVDMTNFGASAETPFGMLPMVMMMNNATGAKGTMESMLPMLLMANGGKIDMDNPVMLMALCGGQSNDMMMGLMLSQAMNKTKN